MGRKHIKYNGFHSISCFSKNRFLGLPGELFGIILGGLWCPWSYLLVSLRVSECRRKYVEISTFLGDPRI